MSKSSSRHVESLSHRVNESHSFGDLEELNDVFIGGSLIDAAHAHCERALANMCLREASKQRDQSALATGQSPFTTLNTRCRMEKP